MKVVMTAIDADVQGTQDNSYTTGEDIRPSNAALSYSYFFGDQFKSWRLH